MEIVTYQRNDVIIYATLRKSDGTPYNLSESNLEYIFKVKGRNSTITKNDTNGIDIYNDVNGIIRIRLTKNDLDIPYGDYTYELVVDDNDHQVRETFIQDKLIIKKSIVE